MFGAIDRVISGDVRQQTVWLFLAGLLFLMWLKIEVFHLDSELEKQLEIRAKSGALGQLTVQRIFFYIDLKGL